MARLLKAAASYQVNNRITRSGHRSHDPTPPKGMEGQWIKTKPGQGWFVYLRLYGPEQAAFEGTWRPGDFELMD